MTLDLLVCGLVVFFALLGALAGGLMQLSHWGALILAGLMSRPLGARIGPILAQHIAAPEILGIIVVTVLGFFTLYLSVQIILRSVLKRVTHNRILGGADRALGLVLGGGKAAAMLYVLLSAMIFFEKPFTSITSYRFDTRGSQIADLVRAHNLFTTFTFPGTQGLTALARAAKNPQAAADLGQDPAFMALTNNPKIQELLRDGELSKSLQGGDGLAMLRNSRVLKVLSDSSLQDQLIHLGANVPAQSPAPEKRR